MARLAPPPFFLPRRTLLGAGLLGLAACGGAKTGASRRVLKIANQKAGTRALLGAAGQLEALPYHIEWSEFPAAGPMLQALAAGAADTAAVGDEPFIFAYASGAPIKAVRAARTVGAGSATAILAPETSPLRGPADLRGRKIGTVKGSTGHFVALKVIEKAGLKPSDVELVYLSNGDAKAALMSHAIDAWATWGSYVAVAVVKDKAKIIADSTGLRTGLAFQAATDKAIATKRDLLEDFLIRLTRARDWAKLNRPAYLAVLAKETGMPIEVLHYNYGASQTVYEPIGPKLVSDEQGVLATFRNAGLIDKIPAVKDAFDASFNHTLIVPT